MSASEHYTIGAIVKRLQSSYPELTVSKVRYLEDEGLLSPMRTSGGFRQYSEKDLKRLETILRLQKTYFYPLSVIKEKLDEIDEGKTVNEVVSEQSTTRLTELEKQIHPIDKIPEMLGIPIGFIRQLAVAGLIKLQRSPKGRDLVDGRDFKLIQATYDLTRYGLEPRHLRSYVQSANRDSHTFEQVLSAFIDSSGGEMTEAEKAEFVSTYENLDQLTSTIHSTLVRRTLDVKFGKNLEM